ncbi:MAG: hypothetical protein R2809_05530 [Flavobacteriales bacterium]
MSYSAHSQIIVQDYPRQFECDIDGISDIAPPVVSSTCGKVNIKFNDEIFSGGCLGTLVRSYTFSDECGNEEYAEQYILLKDNLEPTIYGAPKDMKVKSEAEVPQAPQLASRDNSGQNFEVILEEKRDGKLLIRIWTCTDACGNTATAKQVITIQ